MIIDTSVLIALLREEPESGRFVSILSERFGELKISTANYFEAAIVIDANDDDLLSERLDAVTGEPLLFKGNDFAQTDILAA